MNTAAILENKMERGIRIVINGLLTLLAVTGLIFGFLAIVQNSDSISSFESLLNLKKPGFLLFWISMLGNLYIAYRMDQEASQRHSVKKRNRSQVVSPAVQITYDQASALPNKRKIDISKSFTEEAMKGVEEAWKLASRLKDTEVHPIHLLQDQDLDDICDDLQFTWLQYFFP